MLVRQVDVANLLLAGQNHHHLLRRLNEIHRLGHRPEQKAGNANRPATRVRGIGGLSGEDKLVAFAHDVACPGLENGIAEIGQLLARLFSCYPKLVIRNVWAFGILLHRAGTARRRNELAIVAVPANSCVRGEIGWRALSHRRETQAPTQANCTGENASSEVCSISGHRVLLSDSEPKSNDEL